MFIKDTTILPFVFALLWPFCTVASLWVRRLRQKQSIEDGKTDSIKPLDLTIVRSCISGGIYAGILTALFWYNIS